MNQLEVLLRQIATLFDEKRQKWALVGGLAVSVRTEPRFTRDLDLAVAVPDDQTAEALVHSLRAAGFQIIAAVEQVAMNRLATARMIASGGKPQGMILDLLFASSGIEAEICAVAEPLEVFNKVFVPVARLHHLIVLKSLARDDQTRPQDAADLRQLIMVASSSDLTAACEAARLIEERGYNRSRNLVETIIKDWREFGGKV